ncbi:hypothetical protein [Actinoplanes lutulentus]|nr:hypothetical protein [Actinoplanes lutulentus]
MTAASSAVISADPATTVAEASGSLRAVMVIAIPVTEAPIRV